MAGPEAVARRATLTVPTYVRRPARRLPAPFTDGRGNIYPDRRDDILGETRRDVAYDTVVLENAYLRVTIVPALGGKIWSVYDKAARAEAVHVPDVIKPGLIWVAGGWIPGGFEFNFPIGHHVDGMRRLPVDILDAGPDAASARVTRRCRRSGLVMTVDVTLAAGEARFGLAVELHNPTAVPRPWYQWTNVGVPAGERWQFQAKARWYTDNYRTAQPYPVNRRGQDYSWFRGRGEGDAFMVGCREDFFGYYDHDRRRGLLHVAPWRDVPGKKYFTWGYDPLFNGRTNYSDAGLDYLEIQTGPMETQAHFALLPPGRRKRYAGVWYPIADTGPIEWADEDLALGVRDGRPMLQATAPVDVELRIDGRGRRLTLTPGRTVTLSRRLRPGSAVEIVKNGRRARAFTYPLKGRSEPGADRRLVGEVRRRHVRGRGPAARLARARQAVLSSGLARAVRGFARVLEARPGWHAVRLEYAQALWRTGDFAAAARQLRALLTTRLAPRARRLLARRKQAEAEFLSPATALPAGPRRDLALAERYAGYGRFDAAIRLYRRLLKTDGRNPRVHYGVALYHQRVKRDRRRAAAHAEAAMDLAGPDRDYLLELAPLYLWAGENDALIRRVAAAPPAVRRLTHVRKYLAKAQFETDRPADALRTLRRAPIPMYEGETFPTSTYMDTVFLLVERAIVAGRFARADKLLAMTTLEEMDRLFALREYQSLEPRRGYLTGLLRFRQGRTDQARKIWSDLVDATLAPRGRAGKKLPYWGDWHTPPNPEVMYVRGLAALALGDAGRTRAVMRRLARQGADGAAYWFGRKEPTVHWQALTAELAGDFPAARRLLRAAIRTGHDTRQAQLHLAAVAEGRRRLTP